MSVRGPLTRRSLRAALRETATNGFTHVDGIVEPASLRALTDDPRTLVLFESSLRVVTLLRDVLVELGDRRAVLAQKVRAAAKCLRSGVHLTRIPDLPADQ